MSDKEQKEKLLKLVRDAVQHDHELRQQHQVGEKFRFIRDRLLALLARVEENFSVTQKQQERTTYQIATDEVQVHVYIYNAQGLNIQTWQKMLNPSVFYEYSVNRPIYAEKAEIDALIRGKANKAQHGYITVAIKKQDILSISNVEAQKDSLGNRLIKVKEGSLHSERLISFTLNGQNYLLNEEGQLEKQD